MEYHNLMNANDPPMDDLNQPSLSVGKLGRDRKRKAHGDDYEGRRVRSGAPPPSAFAVVPGDSSVPVSATLEARSSEGWRSCGLEGEEYARAQVQAQGFGVNTYSWSPPHLSVEPRSTGYWASVKKERSSFEQENARQRGAFKASSSPHSTPPFYSEHEAYGSALPPKMHGTPPCYNRYQGLPGEGCAKCKRGMNENAEDNEVQERSKRTRMNAPSLKLPELDATIVTFSYSGLKLGQLLPCGEILGFKELPPLAQLFDLYTISLIQPQPEHAWIQQTWHSIQISIGVQPRAWPQNHCYEEISRSGTERKELAFRAIKTFRELGEKLWQVSIVELMEENLNLFQKEMDYTVLLLLVHRHADDRMMWEQRLRVLFGRLDPALRPRNALARPMHPAPATAFNTQTHSFGAVPLLQPSGLLAVKEESIEHAAFFNAWPQPMGPSTPGSIAQGTFAEEDEPMDMI